MGATLTPYSCWMESGLAFKCVGCETSASTPLKKSRLSITIETVSPTITTMAVPLTRAVRPYGRPGDATRCITAPIKSPNSAKKNRPRKNGKSAACDSSQANGNETIVPTPTAAHHRAGLYDRFETGVTLNGGASFSIRFMATGILTRLRPVRNTRSRFAFDIVAAPAANVRRRRTKRTAETQADQLV